MLAVVAVAPLATIVWAATQAPDVLDGDAVVSTWQWLPQLGLELSFRLDAFALLMVVLVSGIGTLIFGYAVGYFHGDDRQLATFAPWLVAFAGAMLGLVLADNVLLLYLFWELTSITSFFLIGWRNEQGSVRAAALQALLVTGAGGLVMLGGLVLLAQEAGTYSLSGIVAAAPRGGFVALAVILVLVGAVTKSAQVPFHFWLPGAMVAPTPVSAYLHSATMVKAGVYLVARLAPAFATVGPWRPVVIGLGLVSMVLGGLRALREHDLKLVLAYGTISQLGFLMILFGAGTPYLARAGCALLLAHALFKAPLFMAVGIVDHQTHTRDLRRLSGLGRRMPALATTIVAAAASMAAIPPTFGFIAKESAYEGLLDGGFGAAGPTLVVVVAASMLTAAYSAYFVWGALWTRRAGPGSDCVGPDAPRPSAGFMWPAAALAAAGLVAGLAPVLVDALVVEASRALAPAAPAKHLALWHGFNTALVLSVLTIAGGAVAFAARARLARAARLLPWRPSAPDAYQATLRGLNRLADAVTGAVQGGSLPRYLSTVLAVAVIVPGFVLLTEASIPDGIELATSPLQAVVAALAIAAAIATALARRRFVAVLCLGAVGYMVAALFVLQGAPDLALTQLLVETLSVVLFVLALRHLPERFSPARRRPLVPIIISVATGIFAASFVLIAVGARTERPVSDEQVARALPESGGRNVVNTILVDFRGFDTLGEITVLAVTALGVASLVRANRRARRAGAVSEEEPA